MESKLLNIIKSNGTGILKGNFRATILKENAVFSEEEDDLFWEKGKIIVAFSKNEVALGVHLLLVDFIDKKKGLISCTILHNDGDSSTYEPIPGFRDPVAISLFPFTHLSEDDTIGEFIAEFPMGPLNIGQVK